MTDDQTPQGDDQAPAAQELIPEAEPLPAYHEEPTAKPESVSDYMRNWFIRVRSGELGSLPILVGLIIIAIIFGSLNDTFFTSRNFTNLLLQMSGWATIAIGVVFVLLIAEIDLSVAYNSAVGAVILTLLLRPGDPGWPWPLSLALALLVTTSVGLVIGLIVTKAGVPSFVVTLAFNLGLSGVVLILTTSFSTAGTVLIQDPIIKGVAGNFLTDFWGWILAAVVVGANALMNYQKYRSRRRSGLPNSPIVIVVLQVLAVALIVFGGVYVANLDRGVPMVILLLGVLLAFWTFIASSTRFGRHVYAVGGNPEAARRAGINVDRVRIAVFMIGGLMAGIGGVILASRLSSVATNTGGGNLLLNVIAAAVIGGTSLFGGSGRVMSALLGAMVIASVENGMGLLGLASGTKFVITGLVLLAAVLVDALSKRGKAAAGVA